MEKKRKRASFSPTVGVEPGTKKQSLKEDPPVLQQVVEVVAEEPRQKETIPEHHNPIKIEPMYAIDQEESVQVRPKTPTLTEEELREKLRKELKEELRREMEEEQHKKVHIHHTHSSVEEEIIEERPAVVSHQKMAEKEDEIEEVVLEQEPEEERESSSEEEVSSESIDAEEDGESEEDQKQKETVAELFGKNSDALMPEITVHKNSNTRGLLIWAVTMVAIAIGVGGGLVVFTNRSNETPSAPVSTPGGDSVTQESSPSPATSPSPSPKPTSKPVVKKDLKIQVQNGGGVVGAGSKMKAFLEGKGYTVADVGNATNYTYEDTDIVVKESKSDIRDILEEDLSSDYSIGKIETSLPESSPYDARIIVGKN